MTTMLKILVIIALSILILEVIDKYSGKFVRFLKGCLKFGIIICCGMFIVSTFILK